MIDLSSDDGVREAIREIAAWPATAPSADHRVVALGPRTRSSGPRRRQWWAAAAVVFLALGGVAFAALDGDQTEVAAAQGTWLEMAEFPLAARHEPSTLWTGSELVVWGGYDDDGTVFTDGAIYDPSADTWRPMADYPFDHWQRTGAPVGAEGGASIAHVFGAFVDGQAVYITSNPEEEWAWDLVSYDVAGDSWQLLEENRFDQLPTDALVPTAGSAPIHSISGVVAWRGQLVAAGWRSDIGEFGWATVSLGAGGDVEWSPFTEIVRSGSLYFFITLDGGPLLIDDRYFVWLRSGGLFEDVFGYSIDLETGIASLVAYPTDLPRETAVHIEGAMTADGLVVGTATDMNGMSARFARRFDPATLTWSAVRASPGGPVSGVQGGPELVSTPQGHLLLGGISVDGRYGGLRVETVWVASDLDVERWSRLPEPPIDLDRSGHVAIWTGKEVIVWGGATVDPAGSSNIAVVPATDGARYRLARLEGP